MQLEPKHWKIVTDILKKYPYTFYAFGSRVYGTATQLSDLDLCFFDEIQRNKYIHIEEDFERSNLPYKVDLVDWNKCDETFRKIISNDMICVQASDILLKVEKMMYDHFCYLPSVMGFKITKRQETTIINCGLKTSECNIVCNIQLSEEECETKIKKIINEFQDQSSSWWIGPSSQPIDLEKKLLFLGLEKSFIKYLMMYDIHNKNIDLKTNESLYIKKVQEIKELDDFIKVLALNEKYKKILHEKMHCEALYGQEILFIGYKEDKPIESWQLYREKDIASIFRKHDFNNEPGNMYDKDMVSFLINEAKYKYIGVSVSDSDINFYEKLGFKVIGQLKCYIQEKENIWLC